MNIYGSFTRLFIPDHLTNNKIHRVKIGKFQGWVSVVVNTLLFILKFSLGLLSGAISLMADAIHTLSDVVSSVVVIWGFKAVEKPADAEHPYGHGRAEYVATLVIAILLAVVGIEFVKSGIERILHPEEVFSNWWIIAAVAATIVVKELTAGFALFLSRQISSGTLQADAWHHRTDAISSVLVVIAMIGGKFGYYNIDGWAGVGVALIILWTAWEIAREAIDDLLGKPPRDDELEALRSAASAVDGVLGTHDITIHSYGTDKYASLHIEVNAEQPAIRAHDIAEAVEWAISDKLDVNPTVHIDPVYTDHPLIHQVREFLESYLTDKDVITSFHDIRVVDSPENRVILFGVNVNPQSPRKKRAQYYQDLKDSLQAAFPTHNLIMKISPIHKYA